MTFVFVRKNKSGKNEGNDWFGVLVGPLVLGFQSWMELKLL